jgi:hypothetical protein
MSRSAKLTLPREHGAYLTLLGAGVSAALIAPGRAGAIAVAVTFMMAFLLRGPLERLAVGHPPRAWDLTAIVLLTGLGSGAAWLAGAERIAVVPLLAAGALALPVAALLARRGRFLRGARFEMIAMGGLGASAGLAAWCGGLDATPAVALGLVLGAHAAASVPLVQSRVRRRGAPRGLLVLAAAVLVAAGVGLVLIGRAVALVALAPRAAGLAWTGVAGPRPATASAVGLEETGLLALVVAVLGAVI